MHEKEKKVNFSFMLRLTEKQIEILHKEARAKDLSVATIIRHILNDNFFSKIKE